MLPLCLGIEFFESSAKDNVNIKVVFERLVDIICDRMSESLDAETGIIHPQTKQLTESAEPPSSGCKC